MTRPVRTRFAPSPTGELHVGNLRTAVFNLLFARKHGGSFVVRIEDTDLERNLEGGIERILEDLRWTGLDWDEGPDREGPFGPYLQSRRVHRHEKTALGLLERGLAYLCFCVDEEIQARRGEERSSPGCPGGCRERSPNEAEALRAEGKPAAVRFKVPDELIHVRDEVRGDISFQGRDLNDFIILRSDGRSTYNFAVVVDDVEMEITHVIRGAGHLSNMPKQALLFDALQAARPAFVHLPTVLGLDGKKLSKRSGAPGVGRLRAEGFHPEGVVNYLSLLGWSPGDDREVFSREELMEAIDLERVGASDTVYDPEKLRWMSAQHIQMMPLDDLAQAVRPHLDPDRWPVARDRLPLAVEAIRTRLHTFGEVNEHLTLLFPGEETLDAARAELAEEGGRGDVLRAVRKSLGELASWTEEAAGEAVRAAGREIGAKGRDLFHPVRLAIAGARSGPDLGKVLAALGRERSLERLDRALERLV